MSTTTTTTTTTSSTRVGTVSVLSDYELHHSGEATPSPSRESTSSTTPPAQPAQPANWPTDHRRVPAYRPVNRELNLSERQAGANRAEFVFIQTMLHGVWLNAVVSRVWHATGGKINDKIFHYEVGGEW